MEESKEQQFPAPCCSFEIQPEDQARFVKMVKAMGNSIRFEILKYLATHPGCITGNIVEVLPIAQATVSQHLEVLREAGWIQGAVKGKAVSYCLHAENAAWFRQRAREIL
jgi:predicted transcriptional regulator